MSKWIAAIAVPAGLALALATSAEASTTSIQASPASSALGQTVTFTATFISSCAGTFKPHYFTIDGQKYFGQLVTSGQSGTETYSISTLAAGTHTVRYYWQTSTATCIGSASMSYTVSATPAASPSPTPSPSPAPSPSPSPSQSPSPVSSPSAVTLAASKPSDPSLLGYLGGALIVLVVIAGVGLMVLSRR
ncbi:MAG TPA: hypothetical protein VJR46_06765 [Candidatus Dormibacteraeota bacterium]|nr:hypothetical protein [Candidatus Dormibacteraeota bacterium]